MISIDNPAFFRRIAVHVGEFNPAGQLALSYLAEGAANVIFAVRFLDRAATSSSVSSSSDDHAIPTKSNLTYADNTCVLRLRKNLDFTRPIKHAIDEFETRVAPIFAFDPSLLLPPSALELGADIVKAINVELKQLEDTGDRPSMRHGIYLPDFTDERYGIIMKNLFSVSGTVIEFKPKWLVQSPSAPRNAQRCRTCALNAMRRVRGKARGRGDSGFCPFDLLSRNRNILSTALTPLWTHANSSIDKSEVLRAAELAAFTTAFMHEIQPKLRELQLLQREHNDLSIESFKDPDGRDFSVAMALRDCSVFAKVAVVAGLRDDRSDTGDGESVVNVNVIKLLDLDLKDAGGGKLAKWADMERTLIEEGWYTDTTLGDVQCAMAFQ